MSSEKDSKPIMVAYNNHPGNAEAAPYLDNSVIYTGYFENGYRDQWLFQFDGSVWTLQGGDVGWGTRIRDVNGVMEQVLATSERLWLQGCFYAVNLPHVASLLQQHWVIQDQQVKEGQKVFRSGS